MKKAFTYSAIVLLLASVACNKTDSVSVGERTISFAPTSVETRALIEDAAALQAQTFQVYDLLSGETAPYINNTISCTDGKWDYATNVSYAWKDGTHKFFGYTANAGTLGSDNKVTISKVLTTADADQKDLLYSEIFSTTAAAWKASKQMTDSVALHFKHLFAAVSIVVNNATTSAVTINSIDASIKNSGSATLDYNADTVAVTYSAPSVSGAFISAQALTDYSLAAGAMVDVLTQASATAGTFEMVWPQTLADGDQVVNVAYTMNDQSKTAAVKIPAITWEAGKKYSYVLNIYPTNVELTFVVQPWDQESQSINTNNGSINMSNVTWMNTDVKINGVEDHTLYINQYSVYMYPKEGLQVKIDGVWTNYTALDYYPAQGFFTVNYPTSGKFRIGLIPAYGQSTVEEDAYEIWIYDNTTTPAAFRLMDNENGEDITNDTVYFQIRAAAGQDGAQHKAQVDIWFKPTGSDDWISAYSEVRANYACVIPATN